MPATKGEKRGRATFTFVVPVGRLHSLHGTPPTFHLPAPPDAIQRASALPPLRSMTYPLLSELENDFIKGLVDKKSIIEELVRSQLRAQSCRLADEDVWEQGGSHVAIPCYLDPERTVWFRSPLPHAVREHGDCGHGNECLSTEVASYLCIEENCPDVPIPTLHSFGFADGSTVSELLVAISQDALVC